MNYIDVRISMLYTDRDVWMSDSNVVDRLGHLSTSVVKMNV